jgi:murein DD-endopeptidase MepM/ murein hydrolase activator NlpD
VRTVISLLCVATCLIKPAIAQQSRCDSLLNGVNVIAPTNTSKTVIRGSKGQFTSLRSGLGGTSQHYAVDLMPTATNPGMEEHEVRAIADGVVAYARFNGATPTDSFGNTVVIDHRNGCYTLYGHLVGYTVRVNQEVSRGTVIGYFAFLAIAQQSTGNAANSGALISRNQLHFEVFAEDVGKWGTGRLMDEFPRRRSNRLNPEPLLKSLGYEVITFEPPIPALTSSIKDIVAPPGVPAETEGSQTSGLQTSGPRPDTHSIPVSVQ